MLEKDVSFYLIRAWFVAGRNLFDEMPVWSQHLCAFYTHALVKLLIGEGSVRRCSIILHCKTIVLGRYKVDLGVIYTAVFMVIDAEVGDTPCLLSDACESFVSLDAVRSALLILCLMLHLKLGRQISSDC